MPYYVPKEDKSFLLTPYTWSGHVSDPNQDKRDEQSKTVPSYCNMQLSGAVNGK